MLDFIVNPFITILLFLYQILGGNVVLAIVVFTVLVRLATYPLTVKQQRSTKAMQELQPELKKLQEKYKNDRERLAQAQWELYRQYGVNPMAGCIVLIVQLPILLGLYRAIIATLAATPTQLLNLSGRLWVTGLSTQVPLQNKFLWLNLAVPDPLYLLPVLVVVTTWLQQKLLMPATSSSSGSGDKASDQASQMSRQMMMLMPLMFGFFALSFASGLSIYFIASNIIGIGQYAAMGRVRLPWKRDEATTSPAAKATAQKVSAAAANEAVSPTPTASSSATSAVPARSAKKPAPKPRKVKRSGIYDSRAERAKAKSKPKG